MITHSIEIAKEHSYNDGWYNRGHHYGYPSTHTPPVTRTSPADYNRHWRTKQGYADYLKRVSYEKGDYLILRSLSSYPYKPEDYWRVKEIQEIHHLVQWNDTSGLPYCFYIINSEGRFRWITIDMAFKISPPHGFVIPIGDET